MNLKLFRQSIILILGLWGLTGCDEFAAVEDPLAFSGLQKVVANHDGTYTLNWNLVPSDEVSYAVYVKDGIEADFSSNSPEDIVKSSYYITSNLSFVSIPCFVVKDIKADGSEGLNEENNLRQLQRARKIVQWRPADSILAEWSL